MRHTVLQKGYNLLDLAAVGKVIEGLDLIRTIEANPTSRGDAPIKEVMIADCGQIE